MVDDRKATDILISIEQKLELLLRSNANTNQSIKRLLNEISMPADDQNNSFQDEETIISQPPQIEIETVPKGTRRAARAETYKDAPSNFETKNIPVLQRIVDGLNRDIFMAEVNILSQTNELVFKTKTNAMGKWQALLKPGIYTIKISKMDATKKKIECAQTIEISDIESGKLPTAIIKG